MGLSTVKSVLSVLRQSVNRIPKQAAENCRLLSNESAAMTDAFKSSVLGALDRNEAIGRIALNCGVDIKTARGQIAEARKFLDSQSIDRLIKLENEGEIKLFEKPRISMRKKCFDISDFTHDGAICFDTSPVFKFINSIIKKSSSAEILQERMNILKELLKLNTAGKLPASKISSVMGVEKNIFEEMVNSDINLLLNAIKDGSVNSKNIDQALLLMQESLPITFVTKKSLKSLNIEELKDLRSILAVKGTNRKASAGERVQAFRDKICELNTEILPTSREERSKVLAEIGRILTAQVKVNKVSNAISKKFLDSFDTIAGKIINAKSVAELKRAGGITLKYSRDEFKSKIFKLLKELPESEQKAILDKFGLVKESETTLKGLPVFTKNTNNLSKIEKLINVEIGKYLHENEIIVPKGFEEYKGFLDEVCAVFPEFRFAIGAEQHSTQNYKLAEHLLSVFKSNLENPLYKNLNASDRKVLGIATLLHDINKTEGIVDKMHPIASSESVNAIVQRMKNLSVSEKDRIINLVRNHHWLESITGGKEYSQEIVEDFALKFRYGNDFTMAKIFAESDLKGVNNRFWETFGGKINSPMTKEIENIITQMHNRGYMIFTADVTLEKAIANGAVKRIIGEGKNATENYVIKAKDLGLDKEMFLYHAPATDDAFLMAKSGFGYGNEGVFSLTLGKNGYVPTFQNRKHFWGFRQPEKGNILWATHCNGNTGADKDYEFQRRLLEDLEKDFGFASSIKNMYFKLSGQTLSNEKYGALFKEASSIQYLASIHKNEKVIEILGGKDNAKAFEKAISDTQNLLLKETSSKEAGEVVAQDLEPAFIGTKALADEISYNIRKLHKLIVEFD